MNIRKGPWKFRVVFLIATCVLISGTTHTAAAEEEEVAITMAAGHSIDGPALAMFLPWAYNGQNVHALTVWSPEIVLDIYSRSYDRVNNSVKDFRVSASYEVERHVFTNVKLELRDLDPFGQIGVIAQPESSRIYHTPIEDVLLTASRTSDFGSATIFDTKGRENSHKFRYRLEAPHLRSESEGTFRFEGKALLHLWGPQVTMTSDQGTRLFSTGFWVEPDMGAYRKENLRWIQIRSTNLTVELAANLPVTIAMSYARSDAAFITPGGVHVPTNQETEQPPMHQAFAATWILPVFLACFVTGGIYWLRRGRRSAGHVTTVVLESQDADESLRRADAHLAEERYLAAYKWCSEARSLAPTSIRACAMEAFILERLGRVEEALKVYGEASLLAPDDGGYDYAAARLAAEAGYAPEEVEIFLARALSKSPALVEEAGGEPSFLPLEERASFHRILDDARARFTAGPS